MLIIFIFLVTSSHVKKFKIITCTWNVILPYLFLCYARPQHTSSCCPIILAKAAGGLAKSTLYHTWGIEMRLGPLNPDILNFILESQYVFAFYILVFNIEMARLIDIFTAEISNSLPEVQLENNKISKYIFRLDICLGVTSIMGKATWIQCSNCPWHQVA